MVDLPDPTSPIMATVSPRLTLKEILFNALIFVSLNMKEIFSKVTSPFI